MQPGETRVVEFTVRVAPGIRTGQVLWSCFVTGTETDEPYQPNNIIDGYLFVDDGVSPVGDLAIQGVASADGVTGTTVSAAGRRAGADPLLEHQRTGRPPPAASTRSSSMPPARSRSSRRTTAPGLGRANQRDLGRVGYRPAAARARP